MNLNIDDAAERRKIREKMDRCRDEGVCYLCDKPVESGQAVHGATGAHWNCAEKVRIEGEAAIKKLDNLMKTNRAAINRFAHITRR